MVSSADDLRDALGARGIVTVLIGAHAADVVDHATEWGVLDRWSALTDD
ncbi:MAG: hypothetical protein ACKOVH_09745 [Actinomycetota bacterium]